jgi:tRNA (guanosine-2'-O-)-methyltransferase
MPPTEQRVEKFRRVLACRQPDLSVVIENIHDPHNVSAIFRSCDAVGVMRVELLYSLEKFPKIGKKSSSSANKWIEQRRHDDVESCFGTLRAEGFTIFATHLGRRSVSLYDVDLTKPVALVFGNEHRGVSNEASELADVNFQIPMMGMIQSLNVSVAAAVSLYEALRQRRSAGKYDRSHLGDGTGQTLLNEWLGR